MDFSDEVFRRSVGNDVTRTTVLNTRNVVRGDRDSGVVTKLRRVLDSVGDKGLRVSVATRSVRAFVRNRLATHLKRANGELRATESEGSRITLSVHLALHGRVNRVGRGIHNLVNIVYGGTRRGGRAVVPNCARLRHTRPVAFTRRLVTCTTVLYESLNELRSARGEVGDYPLNSNTLTNAACPLSHRTITTRLNFSKVALGSLSNISSHSFYVRLTDTLSLVVIRLSEFSRRVVV